MIKGIGEKRAVIALEFSDSNKARLFFILTELGILKTEECVGARLKRLSESIVIKKQQDEISGICRKAKLKIQEGDLENAVKLVVGKVENIPEEFHNELILLSSEIALLNRKSNLGLEEFEKLIVMRRRMTLSLLELIDRIKRCLMAAKHNRQPGNPDNLISR